MVATGIGLAAPTELPPLWAWTWAAVVVLVFLAFVAVSVFWLWVERRHGYRRTKTGSGRTTVRPPSNHLPRAA
jgi:hypothetical protein